VHSALTERLLVLKHFLLVPLVTLLEQDSLRLTGVETLDAGLPGLLLHLAFQCRVIVVLNVVISAAGEVLGDLGPLVSIYSVILQDERVLFFSPAIFLNLRVQMVVPSTRKYLISKMQKIAPPIWIETLVKAKFRLCAGKITYLSRHYLPMRPSRN
jgi:hypothetical protein